MFPIMAPKSRVVHSLHLLGTALMVETSIVGKTYALDISSGSFVGPAGVGDLIGGLLENKILIGITSVENDVMTVRGAISEGATTDQGMCTKTLEDFLLDSTSPYFEFQKKMLLFLLLDSLQQSTDWK